MNGAQERSIASRQPRKLIRLFTRGWTETDTESRAAFDTFIDRVKACGIDVTSRDEDAEVAELEQLVRAGPGWARQSHRLRDALALRGLPRAIWSSERQSPRIRELLDRARPLTPRDYEARLATRHRAAARSGGRAGALRRLCHAGLLRAQHPAGSRRLEVGRFRLMGRGSGCRRFRFRCSRLTGCRSVCSCSAVLAPIPHLYGIARWMADVRRAA